MTHHSSIESNFGLIFYQVKKHSPTRVTDIEDYFQVGCIALLSALKNYDESKGNWSTYASRAIHRAILKEKRRFTDSVRRLYDKPVKTTENLYEYIPNTLTLTEKEIIYLRLEGFSFEEIGNKYNLTKQRISQILNKIFIKIREAHEQKKNSIS